MVTIGVVACVSSKFNYRIERTAKKIIRKRELDIDLKSGRGQARTRPHFPVASRAYYIAHPAAKRGIFLFSRHLVTVAESLIARREFGDSEKNRVAEKVGA
jgi:hypothetical protein